MKGVGDGPGHRDGFEAAETQFWDLAAPLLARADTEEGTLMSSRCLRVNGDFCAMVVKPGMLVVKLPAERVTELIEQGLGDSFGPAGKVFREWLAVEGDDEHQWDARLREAHTFVGGA